MMPPLLRRCSECGHIGFGPRFPLEERDGAVVVCPSCGAYVDDAPDPRLR